MLEDQHDYFPSLDALTRQGASKGGRAVQEPITGNGDILPAGELQRNGHPVGGPCVKRFQSFRKKGHLRDSISVES